MYPFSSSKLLSHFTTLPPLIRPLIKSHFVLNSFAGLPLPCSSLPLYFENQNDGGCSSCFFEKHFKGITDQFFTTDLNTAFSVAHIRYFSSFVVTLRVPAWDAVERRVTVDGMAALLAVGERHGRDLSFASGVGRQTCMGGFPKCAGKRGGEEGDPSSLPFFVRSHMAHLASPLFSRAWGPGVQPINWCVEGPLAGCWPTPPVDTTHARLLLWSRGGRGLVSPTTFCQGRRLLYQLPELIATFELLKILCGSVDEPCPKRFFDVNCGGRVL